jgi:hypothetical protein
MQNFKRHTLSAVMAASLAAVALGACNRADQRTEGRDVTATTPATTTTGTAGQAVDNAALTTRVKSALLADDQVKGTQINVDSANGVVTLTGTVDNPAHIDRAVELARQVDGVQRVENNLAASPDAQPGLVPGTQAPGTAGTGTTTDRPPGGMPTGTPGVGQPGTTAPAQPGVTEPARPGAEPGKLDTTQPGVMAPPPPQQGTTGPGTTGQPPQSPGR